MMETPATFTYAAITAPETCAIPAVMIVKSSDSVRPARNGLMVKGASVCPMKMLAATSSDSAPLTPMIFCMAIAINILTSIAVPLGRPNVDTDQIIPKQFLKRIERTGYGEFLFFDWSRIQEGPAAGQPDPTFILNSPAYAGAFLDAAQVE